jgi:hypothetical protein
MSQVHLKDYEQAQLNVIRRWLAHDEAGMAHLFDPFTTALQGGIAPLLPPEGLTVLRAVCDRLLGAGHQEWNHLRRQLSADLAEIKDWQDLQQQPLEVCDRLQGRVQAIALGQATVEGLLTAPLEGVGELADVGLSLLGGLKTIQRVGLCYGFGSAAVFEQEIVWSTLATSFAATAVERQHTLGSLLVRDPDLPRQTVAELLTDTALETLTDTTVEAVFEQAIINLSEELSGELVPLVGVVLGVAANDQFVMQVTTTARYVYQLRWLLRTYGGRDTDRAVS